MYTYIIDMTYTTLQPNITTLHSVSIGLDAKSKRADSPSGLVSDYPTQNPYFKVQNM